MEHRKPGVAIVGTGALGTNLARRLRACGYHIEAVFNRTPAQARMLAEEVGASVGSSSFDDLPETVTLIFCCVPDDAVGEVARLLGRAPHDWSRTTVAHTSGALTAAALYGLQEQGAALLSFHPLQTFSSTTGPEAFGGIYVGLEGDPVGVRLGARVAEDLGARPLHLTAEAKMRYHLAASMASNFFVTLMALVGEVLLDAGIERQLGAALVQPLVEGTWRNLQRQLPEEALTGPILRGDRQTVQHHTDELAARLPHLMPVYAALSAETVRLAVRSGRLGPETAQGVLDVLHIALEPYRGFSY